MKRTNKPYSKQNNPIQTNRHFSLRANDRDFFFIYSSNFPRGLSLNYKCYRRHHNDVAKLYASSTNRFSPHSVFNGLLVLTNQIIALRQSSNYNRILYHQPTFQLYISLIIDSKLVLFIISMVFLAERNVLYAIDI